MWGCLGYFLYLIIPAAKANDKRGHLVQLFIGGPLIWILFGIVSYIQFFTRKKT
jgi:hypothetical protein